MTEVNVQLSHPLCHNVDWTGGGCYPANETLAKKRCGGQPVYCLTSVGGLQFVPGIEHLKAWVEYNSISDAS